MNDWMLAIICLQCCIWIYLDESGHGQQFIKCYLSILVYFRKCCINVWIAPGKVPYLFTGSME
jgi:hypothetical protein